VLTTADFFDLIVEHTPCWCPVTGPAATQPDDCPRHVALRKHREAALRDNPARIPQNLFPLNEISAYLHGWDEETPRVVIAVLLWRVTAEFAHDHAPLMVANGASISETAEEYVRGHWEDAETNQAARTGQLISRFLDELGLLEDYIRVKQGRQQLAFAHAEAPVPTGTRRSFAIPGEAWYGATIRQEWDPRVRAEIKIALDVLDEDGQPDGTGLGEWQLIWIEPYEGKADLDLKVPADSWKALIRTRFLELMAELGTNHPGASVPTTEEVVKHLLAAGWVDATVRGPRPATPHAQPQVGT
jgi:hypothetical protein